MEGDSKVVTYWGMGMGDGSWKYVHFIYEIRELVLSLGI